MNLHRRKLLAGAATLPPFMASLQNSIQARANPSQKPMPRFVFCIKSNGLWAEMIQPQNMLDLLPFKTDYDSKGRFEKGNSRKDVTPPAEQKIEKFAPSEPMQPLEPFLDRISILQGINSGFGVYHKGAYQTLGAFQGRRRDSHDVAGQTIDSLIAQHLPRPIPHVCLGHDSKSPSGVSYLPTSAQGKDKPIAFYTKPSRAYKELFGVIDSGAAGDEYQVQSGILDFFAEDTKRIQSNIAGPEREQLDRYLHAFDSIRKSRKEVEAIQDKLKKHAPKVTGEIDPNAVPDIIAGHTDIAIASLLSGLTNVVTLRFDLLGSTSYPGIGGLHGGVGHGQVKNILKARKEICGIHFEQISRMATALDSIPEGEGTMLDNTVFVYTSDNGETHHSSGVNYPVMLLGNLGGRLASQRYFSPGNEQTDRNKPGYTRLGDVWATLLAATGLPYKDFGAPVNGVAHQPIESLLG